MTGTIDLLLPNSAARRNHGKRSQARSGPGPPRASETYWPLRTLSHSALRKRKLPTGCPARESTTSVSRTSSIIELMRPRPV